MDYAALAAGLSEAIPFNVHNGLQTTDVAPGRGVVRLPDDERLRNHVGSQHAAAMFAAGEAASGAAFASVFAERLPDIVPLASRAEIRYRTLAHGEITATARVEMAPDSLLGSLDREGRVQFPVEVELTNPEGTVVADMTVQWHVRRREA
jgi:acyl-coenzyme A thioesterase PaaI-like protein